MIESEHRKDNDETFYSLVQDTPFGIYIVDAEFCLWQVSAGSEKVFSAVHPLIGRDFAEVLGTVWSQPFANAAIQRFRHTLATGKPYHSADTTEQRGDNEEVEFYDWQIRRVRLPDGSFGVVCYFYDLTEHKRSEEGAKKNSAPSSTRLTKAFTSLKF